jgi:hypothetical protein
VSAGSAAARDGGGTPAPAPLTGPVLALERGDWRRALLHLAQGDDLGGRRTVVHLALNLRLIGESMRLQTVGDVTGAQARLDEAGRAYAVATGRRVAGPRPRAVRTPEHLVWRIGTVLEREREELAALRRLCRELAHGRAELVCAFVEHLTWVEFDPFGTRPDPATDRLLRLDPATLDRFGAVNRIDLCRRATDLRHFADEQTGPVSERTWQRMGGYRAIRAEALTMLSGEKLLRTAASGGAGPRLGRLRAWEYARQWQRDV